MQRSSAVNPLNLLSGLLRNQKARLSLMTRRLNDLLRRETAEQAKGTISPANARRDERRAFLFRGQLELLQYCLFDIEAPSRMHRTLEFPSPAR
jgi:hypothetical protein